MSLPAVILCDPETASLSVAGLTVLDRLVVAAHRAGVCSITIVSPTPLPPLPRSAAHGIALNHCVAMPEAEGPTLVLSTRLLAQSADLQALIENRGRLVARDGTPLPAGVVCGSLSSNLEEQLSRLPGIVAQGVAEPITGVASVPAAARALWLSATSQTDGLVDRHFNRPAGRILSRLLIHTPVSPNQVSVAATVLGLCSAWLFAWGEYSAALWGAILLQASAIVDCVDGDLARMLFKESPLGKWLDIIGDNVVHLAVFAGIGIGLHRAGSGAPVISLTASVTLGVVIASVVVMRGLMQPESRGNTRSRRLIDAATNRDFSILLFVLALLDELKWFLWAGGIGVHVFWLLVLAVQMAEQAAPAGLNARRENSS
jgi:phosphatidylglycerophosphate synthase